MKYSVLSYQWKQGIELASPPPHTDTDNVSVHFRVFYKSKLRERPTGLGATKSGWACWQCALPLSCIPALFSLFLLWDRVWLSHPAYPWTSLCSTRRAWTCNLPQKPLLSEHQLQDERAPAGAHLLKKGVFIVASRCQNNFSRVT